MDFPIKLQELRKAKGFSQEYLAEQCNVSRQSVSKWELGQGYPEIEKLVLICKILDTDLDYLLRDKVVEKSEPLFQKKPTVYQDFIGKWVKIFLNDNEFKGLYCAAILAITEGRILFIDEKGKKGLLNLSDVVSVSEADVYKKKNRLQSLPPPPKLDLNGDTSLLLQFTDAECDIRLKQTTPFNYVKPGGFYRVRVSSADGEEIVICNSNNAISVIRQKDILLIIEH